MSDFNKCKTIPTWELPGGFLLHDPSMLVCAGAGIWTGLNGFCAVRQWRGNVDVAAMYAATFLTFACMNVTGLSSWSFITDQRLGFYALLVDCSFSTITAVNFLLCLFADTGCLKPVSRKSHTFVVVLAWAAVALGYYEAAFGGWAAGWTFMYADVTMFCSGVFALGTGLRMLRTGRFAGVGALLGALVVGGVGLRLVYNEEVQKALCEWMGGYFCGLDVWYLESAFAMHLLLSYYKSSHDDGAWAALAAQDDCSSAAKAPALVSADSGSVSDPADVAVPLLAVCK